MLRLLHNFIEEHPTLLNTIRPLIENNFVCEKRVIRKEWSLCKAKCWTCRVAQENFLGRLLQKYDNGPYIREPSLYKQWLLRYFSIEKTYPLRKAISQ